MATPMTVTRNDPPRAPSVRKPRPLALKFALLLAVAAAAGGALYLGGATRGGLRGALRSAGDALGKAAAPRPEPPASEATPPEPGGPWDGLVRVTPEDEKAIGFNFARVRAQTEPMSLELTGRTAYDENTIYKVRPRFDTRVEKVFALPGQKVTKGQPLVELYSTDLAAAKNDFQTKWVQWQHDLKLFDLRQKLVETGAISQQVWVDTQNDEQKSRLDFNLARDKLTVFYEVPREEIDPLLDRLRDKSVDPRKFGDNNEKARMTLRSKAEGYVIIRDVVEGNYYESTDTLMQIAPLDHLWVWVNVYELDQAKVGVGQTMEIQFPFLDQKIKGKIDYVASEISKDTRAVKVRATIPNPENRLKSDMLVKALLDIPPVPGQTLVPRLAMVSLGGTEYVFVRVPETGGSAGVDGKRVDKFQRVKVAVGQEYADQVLVASGLSAGQEVVTNGSLILSQLYEDQRVVTTGLTTQ